MNFAVQFFLFLQIDVDAGDFLGMMVDISRVGIFFRNHRRNFRIETDFFDQSISDSGLGGRSFGLFGFGRGWRGVVERGEGVALGVDVEVDDEGRKGLHLE